MSDISSLPDIPFGSRATDARTRRRRRAEWRLKAYGILAISLAALALVALLTSVVTKAAGALTENYIILPVTLDALEIDPTGESDPKKVLRADFGGLTKSILKSAFPTVTKRKQKRELYDLVSGGAAFELADLVSGDVSLIGQDISFDFLASDVSDLYLKGTYGKLKEMPVTGELVVTVDDGQVQISSSSDDFANTLAQLKSTLTDKARILRRQAKLQYNGVLEFERRAGQAGTDAERRENQTLADARTAARDKLLSRAQDLENRATSDGGTEDLGRDNASILLKTGGGWIKLTTIAATSASGQVIMPLQANPTGPDSWSMFMTELPEDARKISDRQIVWLESLKDRGAIKSVFNLRFFSAGDSREPELAGVWGAAVGTFWTMLVTFALAFPIGVLSAIYLEEFAPKNRVTGFIEVNINNLAAVPSIVFGLLGLSVFLGVFGVPRSTPLAGGIVLALMTLPTIIIASRAAIRAVPPSIRDAALGVGASKLQASFHHVLPLAMPGVMTGSIIGMAQALGETAPLIMIGMVAFIVDIPTGITDSATVLPVQIYRWSDFPERAFEARTAAAICVLLAFLVIMNLLAILLRRRFERRW